MSTVLVTNAYFYPLDQKQWALRQPYPPLGTLLAAAVLRAANYNVIFHDNNLRSDPNSLSLPLHVHRPAYTVIYDDGFNYLTKMCLTVMRNAALDMVRKAVAQGSIVIISSSDAADHYDKYLDAGAHYVLRGEGEVTLRELVHALENGLETFLIPGIAMRQGGITVKTTPRSVLKDLDSLPAPAWDLIDLGPYRKIWNEAHGYFSLNIATTRGCPFKCNWCAKPIYGNRYNTRSVLKVVDEIEMLLASYRPDHFWMTDDIFGLKPGWVSEFQKEIETRGFHIRYKIQSRADLLVDEGVVKSLAASGADTVWIGAESGSQNILDAMDKGITVEQIKKASALLKSHNIRSGFFLQFGYPGESIADIQLTLKMVLELMPDEIGISVSYPLPGTKFYDNVKSDLILKHNWSDSDDLDMMFQGTYPSSYYKILHRYVHSRYRIRRGFLQLKTIFDNASASHSLLRNVASMIYHIPLSWIQQFQLHRSTRSYAVSRR